MSGERVALDTSVAIDVLADQADALLSPSVSEHLLPVPVVGEPRLWHASSSLGRVTAVSSAPLAIAAVLPLQRE